MDKISINLLVPCVVFHNLDPHTGIPFMPHMAAYLAAKIHSLNQYDLKILDMFGADSDHIQKKDNFYVIGLPENKINQYLDLNAKNDKIINNLDKIRITDLAKDYFFLKRTLIKFRQS